MSRLSREGRWGASEARCPVARRGLNESGMRWRKDLQPAPAAKSTTASARQMPLSLPVRPDFRSEEHTSELQSLMRISYAVFCLKKKKNTTHTTQDITNNNI